MWDYATIVVTSSLYVGSSAYVITSSLLVSNFFRKDVCSLLDDETQNWSQLDQKIK